MARRKNIIDNSKSAIFNGTDSGVLLSGYTLPSAFTINIRMMVRNFVNNARVLDNQESGPANGITILTLNTNQIRFRVYNATTPVSSIDSGTLKTNTWYDVCAVYTQDDVRFYIDGVEAGNDTSATMTEATADLYIGKRKGGSSYADIIIDDFKIYNRALTASEVTDLGYYKEIEPTTQLEFNDNLNDKYGLNNGTEQGTIVYDSYVPIKQRSSR